MSDGNDREFARMMIEDDHHTIEEKLKAREGTFICGEGTITMSESEWMGLFGQVASHFKWATSVTCWPEFELLLRQHVGFTDDEDADPEEFFTEYVSKTQAWTRPMNTIWSPTVLAANVLAELGYFDEPDQMVGWMMNVVKAEAELEELANSADDEDDREE